jgi:hypothetical protein
MRFWREKEGHTQQADQRDAGCARRYGGRGAGGVASAI